MPSHFETFALGLIEGFYGEPWSWQAREDYAPFLKTHGFRFYIYAPKADEYLRRNWRADWPDEEWEALERSRAHYRSEGVLFGIGVLDGVYYTALLVTGTNAWSPLPGGHVLAANVVGGAALMAFLHRASRSTSRLGLAVLKGHPMIVEGIVTQDAIQRGERSRDLFDGLGGFDFTHGGLPSISGLSAKLEFFGEFCHHGGRAIFWGVLENG